MITAGPRRTSRVGLFAGILSALLFAVLHCSFHLPGDEHAASGTTSVSVPAGAAAAETAPQHPAHPARPDHPDHHADCLSPGLAPQAQNETRHPADAEPPLPLTPVADPASADPAAPRGAGAARAARTGRSTLTSVCRWRI
ncbi:hypothetical protein ACIPUC_04180 [Streptomyces sp. LARHCF249]